MYKWIKVCLTYVRLTTQSALIMQSGYWWVRNVCALRQFSPPNKAGNCCVKRNKGFILSSSFTTKMLAQTLSLNSYNWYVYVTTSVSTTNCIWINNTIAKIVIVSATFKTNNKVQLKIHTISFAYWSFYECNKSCNGIQKQFAKSCLIKHTCVLLR